MENIRMFNGNVKGLPKIFYGVLTPLAYRFGGTRLRTNVKERSAV
jgi:hypothetical protein